MKKKKHVILPSSYDVIGSRGKAVAILEIFGKTKKQEKEIAENMMKMQKNIKTVLKKVSGRKGKERIKA